MSTSKAFNPSNDQPLIYPTWKLNEALEESFKSFSQEIMAFAKDFLQKHSPHYGPGSKGLWEMRKTHSNAFYLVAPQTLLIQLDNGFEELLNPQAMGLLITIKFYQAKYNIENDENVKDSEEDLYHRENFRKLVSLFLSNAIRPEYHSAIAA